MTAKDAPKSQLKVDSKEAKGGDLPPINCGKRCQF